MIKCKTLYFGYGDIGVGSNSLMQTILFVNIKPPQECGEVIPKEVIKDIDFGDKIIINLDDYDLYNLFCSVNENNRIIKYKDYIFDFTNYNNGSIQACKDGCKNALYLYQLSLGC